MKSLPIIILLLYLLVMNFDGLIQTIQKTLGNAVFPQMEDKGGGRGMVGDFLAEKYYTPPLISPVATNTHPLQFRNEDMRAMRGETLGAEAPPQAPMGNTAMAIQKGLADYQKAAGVNMPIATMSAQLAEAGQGLPDPLLAAIMPLIETAGGTKVNRGQNNAYNMLPTREGVNYPDLSRSILGGEGEGGQMHKGFKGLLQKGGLYNDYHKSGNLEDFFSKFSPASENASIPNQVTRYNQIRQKYFEPYL